MNKRILAMVLGVVVLVALGTTGGFFYGKSVGQGQANQARQQFMQGRFQGQVGQFPARDVTPAANARQGGGTTGTIQSITGNTLVVKTQNGNEVTVKTTDTTLIEKLSSVSVSDLQTGEQVIVSGSQNDDGSISARSIQSGRAFQGARTGQP